MGLELAEMVMDLEEAFGVKFEWDHRLRTVGDTQEAMAEAVERALKLDREQARERYATTIADALGIGGPDLDRPILAVVPDLARRLPELTVTSWWDLPRSMRRPAWLVGVLWAITPVGAAVLALASPRDRTVAVIALVFGPMLAALLAWLTDAWRPRPPLLGNATARGLIDRAVERFSKQNAQALGQWHEHGVVRRSALDAKVLAIIAERCGRKPETIKNTDHLVDDLGMG